MRHPLERRLRRSLLLLVALSASSTPTPLLASGEAHAPGHRTEAAEEFERRVKDYMKLVKRVEHVGKHKKTDVPGKIEAREQSLASSIRAARGELAPGSIFIPAIAKEMRTLATASLKGPLGGSEKKTIKDETPPAADIALKVNAEYPPEVPLGTMPPALLEAFPRLPEGLEYRFVGRHLLLRDVRANLIVDFIENFVPKV